MGEDRLENLIADVARLKRQNRVLRGAGLVVLCALAGLVLVNQKNPDQVADVLQAKEFLLVDSEGYVRAALGFSDGEGAEPGLDIYDRYGELKLSLAVLEDETPGIALFDSRGELRTVIDIDEEDSPGMYLYDGEGILRGMMTVFADGSPDVTLFDKEGAILWGSP
jgi:hypothetical protein